MKRAIEAARKAHQRALEVFYEDTCTVYEYRDVTDEKTNRTSKKEVVVLEEIPCKISFESIDTAEGNGAAAEKKISTKLFLSPDVVVNAGSKIEVTHRGETVAYSNTGVPGKFYSHQEIELKLFERWA